MPKSLAEVIEAQFSTVLATLPALPAIVRYYDDFGDTTRTVRDIDGSDSATLILDGQPVHFKFTRFGSAAELLKHVWCDWIAKYTPNTMPIMWGGLLSYIKTLGVEQLIEITCLDTVRLDGFWNTEVFPEIDYVAASSLRALLHSLCRLRIGSWQQLDAPRIRNLASPKQDKFRAIRLGDCLISPVHQAKVIDYLEDVAAEASNSPLTIPTEKLIDAALLVIHFENGLRPGQTGRIKFNGLKLFENGSVHITFPQRKQHAGSPEELVTRRIGRRFTAIFLELHRRRTTADFEPNSEAPERLLFRMTPKEVSIRIQSTSDALAIGRRSPTDFRHTAAQRLADSGASEATISKFLTHKSTKIGSVYFRSSPIQAKIVNDALALSDVYSPIAQTHQTRTIDVEALIGLSADNQIGGVPHGTPISGIGGCSKGQSTCQRTPVLACYTCTKFLALSEIAIHENVLDELRNIINGFVGAARGEIQSPAYVQLQATAEAVRLLILELKQRLAS